MTRPGVLVEPLDPERCRDFVSLWVEGRVELGASHDVAARFAADGRVEAALARPGVHCLVASRDDRLVGDVPHGPHLGNRVGNVQGGALFGLAATAARRLVGGDQQLADGSLQFLRPGTGGDLRVSATLLRRGRTVSAVEAEVSCDGRVLVSGHFSLMA